MLYIYNDNTNPYFNLAAEEYLLKNTEEEYFMLWRNEPCIVVGKNQNTLSEINFDYVRKNNINVVRRLTGGGAVFHDLGNLNFTFIVNDGSSFKDFQKFVDPILTVLKELGVEAEFSGRNDLLIKGRKFSGNAQCKHKNRVMHHGTLLFSSNMADLSAALISNPIKFSDKGVKSINSRVTNISEHLKDKISVLDFKNYIFQHIALNEKNAFIGGLGLDQIVKINNLVQFKYNTWEWNYGRSPKYNFSNEKKFLGGTLEVMLQVNNGVIESIKLFGDYFGQKDTDEIEGLLVGASHSEEGVAQALKDIDLSNYFWNITLENLLEVMF